jgi:hypothetical protein
VNAARVGNTRNAYKILVTKPEGKRALGSRRCGWEDFVKVRLHSLRTGTGRFLVWMVMNLRVS